MNRAPITLMYFTGTGVRGGVEEHILLLLQGLDRKYFRLLLVCPPELIAQYGSDLPADVELVPLYWHKATQVATAWRLAEVIWKQKVDILHSHLFLSSRLASPIAWLSHVPVIIETPHVREQWRRGWFKSHYFVDRLAGRFVDYYIAVSEANARYLIKEKGLPTGKVRVIHNGSNLRRLNRARTAPEEMKRTLGFSDDDPVLAVLARLEAQKGHRVLFDALVLIRREFPGVRLVCVGDGSQRKDLEQQTRDLKLQEAVRFVGYQANVADWLALADITVLPSFYEGLPLAAIESLVAARPVVATAVDGTPEVIVDGKTGFTVPPGNPARLAEAICQLLRYPELRRCMGLAGRNWVQDRFSEERQVQLTQDFYLEAWERSRGAAKALKSVASPEKPLRTETRVKETPRLAPKAQ